MLSKLLISCASTFLSLLQETRQSVRHILHRGRACASVQCTSDRLAISGKIKQAIYTDINELGLFSFGEDIVSANFTAFHNRFNKKLYQH